MDPRLDVGENYVYITLRDSSKKSFKISNLAADTRYLYPDAPGDEYGGPGYVHPIFHLGYERYYFDIPVIGKVKVVSALEIISPTPDEPSDKPSKNPPHYEYNDTNKTITLESKDGSKDTYPSSHYPAEYLQPERFVGWWLEDDNTPIFEIGQIQYRFGFLRETPVIFHLTYLDVMGRLSEEEFIASNPTEIQVSEYLPRKHPDVYGAFRKALKTPTNNNMGEFTSLIREKAARIGYEPISQERSLTRVGLYRILLEYLYHTGVLSTSSDLQYDLTRDQLNLVSYPTWDPYVNTPNFATTRSGYSKWIACRLACKVGSLPVPTKLSVKVQTDDLGYAIVSNTNNEWIEKRDDWPMRGLRSRDRDDELFEWFNSRIFAYYVMGHVQYGAGEESKFPVSPCSEPEFKEYAQRFEFMPVKEIDISIRKTADWCQLYNYNVEDHEGVGLYPKINTLQIQGFTFSNFDCSVGYTVDEAIQEKRAFPLLQLDAEHDEPVDLMYEYNKRYYRLNMYERRVYMTKNPVALSTDAADVRGDYWLYSRYNVEYQENSKSYFPQKARVARDPVNTYPLAADDAVALSYDAIQQDKVKSKYGYVWVEVGASVLAGVLTTLAVQYLGQDIQVSVISGGVVLFTGLLITLILNLGDIIRSIAGETVELGRDAIGL